MNLGVCYYPEQWAEARWEPDAKLLRAAGLTIVRMAEFAWSQLEPRRGEFEFGWLDRAIDVFAGEGFKIVLGTPTAAPPAWLSHGHPETLPVDDQGRRRNFGGRRHYCPNSGVYREYTERIVRAMGARYGQDARVIGWQIDNEFGDGHTGRCYCDICAAEFRAWLIKKYGTLDALNDAWGNVFWSQNYSDWTQIGAPILVVGASNPSHTLDYYRFSSDSIALYQQLQIAALDPLRAQHQFITHNFMGLFSDLDQYTVAEPLDFAAWDSYPTGNFGRWKVMLADAAAETYAYDVGNPVLTGMAHALTRGLKQGAPYWIMEQQAGNINWGDYNPAPRPHVLHLWLWHNFAAGAETTVFFRERATFFAQEQYHSGLLNHIGSLAQGYHDLLAFTEQHALMQALQDTRVVNEVAILVGYEDLWALELQPHRHDFSYWNVSVTWYAALARAGVPCDVVSKNADLSKYKLVIAPSLHLANEALAEQLKEYAAAGGVLVLGIRSGFKTPTNRVTDETLPGALRELVGAKVTSWQSLPPDFSVPIALMWRGWHKIQATRWIETLETETAGVLASYTDSHLAGQAAMTVNYVGMGRVMYVGWLPNEAQADSLIGMMLPQAQIEPIGILPHGVIAGRRVGEGETYFVLMNFTDEEKRAWVNGADLFDAANNAPVLNEVVIGVRGTRILGRRQTASARSPRE